jgi:uncharacterized protein YodC (DUF2158 family)
MQTNNAHEYTDEQLQAAIDAARSLQKGFYPPRNAEERKHLNLLEARAFLAALPKPDHFADVSKMVQPSDPCARLKAYNEAGARIRYIKRDWRVHFDWDWGSPAHCFEVHPDDLHMVSEYAPKPWTPRPGDVVRLKSGGPEMTVNTVAEGYACLIWIDASGFYHLCNATFSALTPAKDSSI